MKSIFPLKMIATNRYKDKSISNKFNERETTYLFSTWPASIESRVSSKQDKVVTNGRTEMKRLTPCLAYSR